MKRYAMFVNGEFVKHGGAMFPVRNPATDEVISEVPAGDVQHVDAAVAAAERARCRSRFSPVSGTGNAADGKSRVPSPLPLSRCARAVHRKSTDSPHHPYASSVTLLEVPVLCDRPRQTRERASAFLR